VTIAKRPFEWDGMARDMDVIWGKREGIYFCRKDWTGSISLMRFNKLLFWRTFLKDCRLLGPRHLMTDHPHETADTQFAD
jgi:hypothetical protein